VNPSPTNRRRGQCCARDKNPADFPPGVLAYQTFVIAHPSAEIKMFAFPTDSRVLLINPEIFPKVSNLPFLSSLIQEFPISFF
jgi:hypothetical protein